MSSIRVSVNNDYQQIIDDILLGGAYHYIHDEFAGETLSELWVENGTGQNYATSTHTVGAWGVLTKDTPTENDIYALYGKQEFLMDKAGCILTMRGSVSSTSTTRACFGLNNPHGDSEFDWYNVGTSIAGGLCFEYNSTIGANWQCRVIDGATDWVADTGVPMVANTLYDFRIERTATDNIEFKLDGTVVANYTDEFVNDSLLSCGLMIQTFSTSKRWLVIDFVNYLRPKD